MKAGNFPLEIFYGYKGLSENKSTVLWALHTIFAYNLNTSNTHFFQTIYIKLNILLHQQYIKWNFHQYLCTLADIICCWVCVLLLPVHQTSAQPTNLGLPWVQHYSKRQLQAGTQSWGFAQTERGVLLVANNDGLLTGTGQTWKTYPLPNHTIARSVAYESSTGRIYVGGQDAFGYFLPDDNGQLHYFDLKPLITGTDRAFTDVWNIVVNDDGIFFRASDRVYHYTGDKIRAYWLGGPTIFLGEAKGDVIAQVYGRGLLRWSGTNFEPLQGSSPLSQQAITAVVPLAAGILIATEQTGLYHYYQERLSDVLSAHKALLSQIQIRSLALLSDNRLAIGSAQRGLLIADLTTERILHWLQRSNGLQNNTVRSLYADRQGDLWLGLDYGIDLVATSQPFTEFFADGELQGATYDLCIGGGQLYVGTANGLYRLPWQSYYDPLRNASKFEAVERAQGQIWGLNWLDGQLFVGAHAGALLLRPGESIQQLSPDQGYWRFIQMNDSIILGGSYYGLSAFQKKGGRWQYERQLEGLQESSRILSRDPSGAIWMSHPYRGIYRLRPDKNWRQMQVDHYGKAKGLASDLGNQAIAMLGEIISTDETSIYRWQADSNHFFPHSSLNQLLGMHNQQLRFFPATDGKLWYTGKTSTGYIRIIDKGLEKEAYRHTVFQIRNWLVGGFEKIYPYDSQRVFIAAERGVILYQPEANRPTVETPASLIAQVYLSSESSDSLFFSGEHTAAQFSCRVQLSSDQNTFRFLFGSITFGHWSAAYYQYRLIGLEDEWSDWTQLTTKEYTNLPAGSYRFEVRSSYDQEEAGEVASFSFVIGPPWYQTTIAKTIFALLLLSLLLAIILIPQRKFAKEKAAMQNEYARQQALQQQAVEASERTIDQLLAEKLAADIAFKNQELANTTLHLVQKNELLVKIRAIADKIELHAKNIPSAKDIAQLQQLLREDQQIESDWEQFAFHFDQVHHDFLKRLQTQYPRLSAKDQRLCAYLRLNLSTKEIAPLMNISVRGLEISRYRLRKKLNLGPDVNLNEFMTQL